jgi:hypothetical protein
MNPLPELDQLNLYPAAKTQVAAMLQALIEQNVQDAQTITNQQALLQAKDASVQAKDFKIAALTHELAYYKRIRFSTRSEVLASLQRDVFEETWNTDISAIAAEVEQLQNNRTVTAAPIPPAVIDGGMAAVGLLTWVMIGKFLDHLPLYRPEQIAARDGVILSRSTLADRVGRLGVALQPLADHLAWHLLQRDCLHADETPVPQLDPGNGKTQKAYLWAYRSNNLQPGPKLIVFDYQAGRSGRHAQQFLQDWQGHLLVDDYGGYKALFAAARAHPETHPIPQRPKPSTTA